MGVGNTTIKVLFLTSKQIQFKLNSPAPVWKTEADAFGLLNRNHNIINDTII